MMSSTNLSFSVGKISKVGGVNCLSGHYLVIHLKKVLLENSP